MVSSILPKNKQLGNFICFWLQTSFMDGPYDKYVKMQVHGNKNDHYLFWFYLEHTYRNWNKTKAFSPTQTSQAMREDICNMVQTLMLVCLGSPHHISKSSPVTNVLVGLKSHRNNLHPLTQTLPSINISVCQFKDWLIPRGSQQSKPKILLCLNLWITGAIVKVDKVLIHIEPRKFFLIWWCLNDVRPYHQNKLNSIGWLTPSNVLPLFDITEH